MVNHKSKQDGVALGQYIPPHLRGRAKSSINVVAQEDQTAIPPSQNAVVVGKKSGYTPPHLRNRPQNPQLVANASTVDVSRPTEPAENTESAGRADPVAQPNGDVVHQNQFTTSSTIEEHTESAPCRQEFKQSCTLASSPPPLKVDNPYPIDSTLQSSSDVSEPVMVSPLLRDLQLKIEQTAREGSAARTRSQTRGSSRASRANSASCSRRNSGTAQKQPQALKTHSIAANDPSKGLAAPQVAPNPEAALAVPDPRPDQSVGHVSNGSNAPTPNTSSQVRMTNDNLASTNACDEMSTNLPSSMQNASNSTTHQNNVPPQPTANVDTTNAPATTPAVKWWSTDDDEAQIQPTKPAVLSDTQPQPSSSKTLPTSDNKYAWIDVDLEISREEFDRNYTVPKRGNGGGRGRNNTRGRGGKDGGRGCRDGGGGGGGRGGHSGRDGGLGGDRAQARYQRNNPEPLRRSQWPKKSAIEAAKDREDWKDGIYCGEGHEDLGKHREIFAKEARLGNINSFNNDNRYVDEEWILGGFAGRIVEEQLREKLEKEDEWGAIRHLCNWDGGWGPPPLDWQERNRYRRRNMYAVVYEWVALSEAGQGTILEGDPSMVKDLRKRIKKPAININHKRFLGSTVVVHGEEVVTNSTIAPRYWIPDTIDDDEIDLWWNTRGNRCPGPDDAEDIAVERKPFWYEYGNQTSPYLKTHVHPHPDTCIMNPADEDYDLYGTHPTSALWAGAAMRRLQKEKDEKNRKRVPLYRNAEERERSVRKVIAIMEAERLEHEERLRGLEKEKIEEVKVAIEQLEPIAEETKQPAVNMYVRPATDADLPQIMKLWNWYQERTVYVPEHDAFTLDQVRQRVEDITVEKCPFFVAVEKGQKHKGKRNKNSGEETILGFAFADRTHTLNGMYRGCAEIEIFIDDKHTRSGLGTRLLEQVIAVCDPEYTRRQECESRIPTNLIFRRFVNFLILLPSETEKEHAREIWVGKWLGVAFGFKYTGKFEMMGARHGKWVDQSHYQLRCKGVIDPRDYDG